MTCRDMERNRPTRYTHFLETAEGWTCLGTERNRPSDGTHSLEATETDLLGHGKKSSDRGALTSCTWQREVIVRTWKETGRATGTHVLETAEEETCQETKRNKAKVTHKLGTAEGRTCQGMEKSDQAGAHTHWRR